MKGVNWDRWARASGIGFVVLFVAAFIIYGEPPKVNDPADKIAAFYDDHGGRLIASDIVFGFAFVLLLAFIGAIANTLREAGQGLMGAVTLGAGTAFVAIQAITGAILGALAINVAVVGDEGVVRTVNTLLWTPDVISAFPLATTIFAATIGLSRTGIGASWYGWLGALAGVLVVLHGTNMASSGFWSPTGGYVIVTSIAALVWALVTSILLVRQTPERADAPERAAVPST